MTQRADKIGMYIRIIEAVLTHPNRSVSAVEQTANINHQTGNIQRLTTCGLLQLRPKQLGRRKYSKTLKTVSVTAEGVRWLHAARAVVAEVSEKRTVKVMCQ